MCSRGTKKSVIGVFFLGLVTMVVIPALASPHFAAAPTGTWSGALSDGTVVTLFVAEDGAYNLAGTSPRPIVGTWNWTALTAMSGILNCEPADWPSHPITAYNVIWLGANRIEHTNGSFRVVLQRMI